MDLREDDLTGDAITALLRDHLAHMARVTPAGSVYALDVERLRAQEVTFWSAWEGAELVGCVGLKELDTASGEIKSMHTVDRWRRRGVASVLVEHVLAEAARRGYARVYLETGATEAFAAARALYARHGFEPCDAFGDYGDDPHSHFMTRAL